MKQDKTDLRRREHGSGGIEERGQRRWLVTVELGRDPRTGRRLRERFTVRGSKRDALQALRERQQQRDHGMVLSGERLTTAQWLEQWLAIQGRRLKPSTMETYGRDVQRHFIPALGSVPLRNLRAVQVQLFLERALDSGLTARTVRRLHRELHASLQMAVRLQHIAYNPATNVVAPRVEYREARALSAEECRRLLHAAEGGPHYAAIYLALATGLRRGELLALHWEDVDLDRGELRVRRTIREIPGQGSVMMAPKTPRSRRPVALSEQAVAVLRAHRIQQHERRLKLGEAWADRDLVFPTTVGTPWVARNMLRGFWKAAEAAGLERLTFHTLRHTAASLMAQAGVPVTSISAQLGHANPAVTQSIYSHVLPGMQDDAAQRLAVVLGR